MSDSNSSYLTKVMIRNESVRRIRTGSPVSGLHETQPDSGSGELENDYPAGQVEQR